MRRVLSVLVLLAIVWSTRPARADQDDARFAAGVASASLIGAGVVGLGTLVPLIGNAVKLGRHKPSHGWGVAGVVVGTLEAVAGTLTVSILGGSNFAAEIGTPFLAVGAANIGLGAASLVLSKRVDRARVSIVPVSGLDSTGHQMFGAALRFTL
jgi:hypothetical protein